MIEKIRTIIAEYVEIDPSEITEATTLKTDLGLSSLSLMNLLVDLEDAYDIEIDEEAAVDFSTIGDVIDYMKGQGIR